MSCMPCHVPKYQGMYQLLSTHVCVCVLTTFYMCVREREHSGEEHSGELGVPGHGGGKFLREELEACQIRDCLARVLEVQVMDERAE